ncbi:unnamed protein product, partial [Ectocarpus sp. 12 AP-2014]
LEEARAQVAALLEEEEFLRHAVGELDAVSPEIGEDAALDARRRLMQSAEKIREDIAKAHAALGAGGAEGMMRDATRWLEAAATQAEGALDPAMAALERAMSELGDAEDGVARALAALAFDAGELERVEERLFSLRGLARKHNVQPDELSALAEDLGAKLVALDAGAGDLVALEAELDAAQKRY